MSTRDSSRACHTAAVAHHSSAQSSLFARAIPAPCALSLHSPKGHWSRNRIRGGGGGVGGGGAFCFHKNRSSTTIAGGWEQRHQSYATSQSSITDEMWGTWSMEGPWVKQMTPTEVLRGIPRGRGQRREGNTRLTVPTTTSLIHSSRVDSMVPDSVCVPAELANASSYVAPALPVLDACSSSTRYVPLSNERAVQFK